ncbi:metallopeptidase MepB [Trametes gibbosa]|nr:metallopeptidase MepB [Trametes gibbosa]
MSFLLKAPQAPLSWSHTPQEVKTLMDNAFEGYRAAEDRVAALKADECTFKSVSLALAEARRIATVEPLSFYQNVSTSKDLRNAANKAEVSVKASLVDSSMRPDVFRAKQAAKAKIEKSGRLLSEEERRLVNKMILDGTRAGLALPDAERSQLTRLHKELSQACSEFCTNCNEENGHISFTLEELKGVPTDVISGYNKRTEGDNDVYDVTFQYPDMLPLLKFASNPETRRAAYEGFEGRLAVNEPILKKILGLRREIADLLGYASWADYVTEVKMVKSAEGVGKFLSEVAEKLRPVGLKDRESLLELKKKEYEEKELPFDGEVYAWDNKYYERMQVEGSLGLDDRLVKEHFPVSIVIPTILDIYSTLLGAKFVESEGETWHPDVQLYAVWEKDAKDPSDFLGYFYLDIYPRESKFSGAGVWPLVPGYDKADGTRQYPVAAMVANLAKPTPERPALMQHSDVVTFFHEIGHGFHELLSRTRFARFHGTTVALDFGEAPSQMLENWCYEPKVLKRMSSHYETGKPLDDESVESIKKSRYVNVGLSYLTQVHFSTFDLKVHVDQEPADYTKLWNELRESIGLLKSGTLRGGPYTFDHIAGGYDVGLYGYMYSLVFAADMYATVFKADPLNPERGRRYREKILRPGSSKDENELMKDFLGREPNAEAFIRQLFGMP